MPATLSRRLLWLSIGAYIVCLPLSAVCPASGDCPPQFTSGMLLIYGWGAIYATLLIGALPLPSLIWLANPILLVAWLLIAVSLRKPARTEGATWARATIVAAVLTSGLAFLLASCFLLQRSLNVVASFLNALVPGPNLSREAGYWLWLASMASALSSALLLPVPATPANAEREEAAR